MPVELIVFLVLFFALFLQALAGFGSALLSMPILAQALGITVAAPLFALCALVGEFVMISRHRKSIDLTAVWRLMVAALVGIPIGIIGVSRIPEEITLFLLGLVTTGYALYALSGLRVPPLTDKRWAFPFGFVSGILSGAYNTGGPPYVIYSASKGWAPQEFKANLQSVFVVSSIAVITGHTLSGNMNSEVLRLFALALPAVITGLLLGFVCERFVSPAAFRKGILVLLLLIGLTLIF